MENKVAIVKAGTKGNLNQVCKSLHAKRKLFVIDKIFQISYGIFTTLV
jgi:hypothetical protein